MMEWASRYSDLLQVATGVITALVWVFYLHLIHASLRRRRRSCVLINAGGSCGFSGSCFIVNIALEPVYVSDILLLFEIDGTAHKALLTDRAEVRWEDLSTPAEATLEGPLGSNEQLFIGTFEQLCNRAALASRDALGQRDIDRIERLEVTAVLASAAGSGMVGARRAFRVVAGPNQSSVVVPETIGTHQIRFGRERRRLENQMKEWTRCQTASAA